MTFVSDGTFVLATLTFLSDIFLVWYVGSAALQRILPAWKEPKLCVQFRKWIAQNALQLALLAAIVSMSGSLFFSEVALYTPCKLCWLQRIFMYPLVAVLGVALATRDKNAWRYALALAVPGAILAAYQYATQVGIKIASSCAASGGVDCTAKYFFYYGYITIPTMALTGFLLIISFSLRMRASRA